MGPGSSQNSDLRLDLTADTAEGYLSCCYVSSVQDAKADAHPAMSVASHEASFTTKFCFDPDYRVNVDFVPALSST